MNLATIHQKFRWITLLSVLVLGWAQASSAQITLSSNDVTSLQGKTFQVTSFSTTNTSGLQPLIDAKGANQTWDFTQINSFQKEYSGTITYKAMPADMPGADLDVFSEANMVMQINYSANNAEYDSSAWAYQKVTDSGVDQYGIFYIGHYDFNQDGQTPDSLVMTYDPEYRSTVLPLEYQTAWSDSSEMVMTVSGQQMGTQVSMDAEVDGYGTLKLPGITTDALRISREQHTYVFGMGTSTRTIEFTTAEGAAVSATIEFDMFGQPESASYTVMSEQTAIEKPGQSGPQSFSLEQNYPNPFNPSTIIGYELNKANNVKLDVYNTMGQKVATLINERQAAGSHRAVFEAGDLPSGIYFYNLQAGSRSMTKKMVLMK